MAEITIEELKDIATDFLRSAYGLSMGIPIVRNNRLRSSMGRFLYSGDGTSHSIEIAGFTLEYGAREAVIDLLKHECVHYALHERDEPNDDEHPHFEAELRKHGVTSSGTNRIGKVSICKCGKCGDEWESDLKRIVTHNNYYSSICCRARIHVIGERIYDGTETEGGRIIDEESEMYSR